MSRMEAVLMGTVESIGRDSCRFVERAVGTYITLIRIEAVRHPRESRPSRLLSRPFQDRLTVGQRPLKPWIEVQILVLELKFGRKIDITCVYNQIMSLVYLSKSHQRARHSCRHFVVSDQLVSLR